MADKEKKIKTYKTNSEDKSKQIQEDKKLSSENDKKDVNPVISNEMGKGDKKKDNEIKKLEQDKPEEENKVEGDSIIDKYLFILYSVIYIVLVYSVVNISLDYNCYTSLKTLFNFSGIDTSMKISPFEIVPDILSKINTIASRNFILQEKFELISNIRINQRRLKLIPNIDPYFIDLNNYVWADDLIGIENSYDSDIEEDYAISRLYEKKIEYTYMGKGGIFLKVNNSYDPDDPIKVKDLTDSLNEFIKNNTYIITLDFILLNNEINYLHSFLMKYTLDPSGMRTIDFKLGTINLNTYGTSYSSFRTFLEIIFCILLLVYCLIFVFDIIRDGDKILKEFNKKREKLMNPEDKEKDFKKEEDMDEDGNDNELISQIPPEMGRLKSFILAYFSNFLVNTFLLVSFIISIIGMINWYQFSFSVLSVKNDINPKSKMTLTFLQQNKIIYTGRAFKVYIENATYNFLFLFLKILKYVGDIMPQTQIFFHTLDLAKNDMVSFYIFFITVLLAFVFYSNIYFGKFISDFANIWDALQINFSFVLGSIDRNIMKKIYTYSQISVIYIFLLCVILKYILLKILLAIIMYYYKTALDKFITDNRDISGTIQSWKVAKQKYKKNELVQFAKLYNNLVNQVWDILLCVYCRKKDEDLNLPKKKTGVEEPIKELISEEKKEGDNEVTDQQVVKKEGDIEATDQQVINKEGNGNIEIKNENINENNQVEMKEEDNIKEKSIESDIKSKESNVIILKNDQKISLRFKYMAEQKFENLFVNDTFQHCQEESEIFIEKKVEVNESEDDLFGIKELGNALISKINKQATIKNVEENAKKNEDKTNDIEKNIEEKTKLNDQKENKENEKDKVPKDFENFNQTFSENYILMRDKYFESEKDEVKLASYYENKYRQTFLEVILHIIFLVLLIILLFFNSLPSWHYIIHTNVGNLISDVEIKTSKGESKSIFNISNYEDIKYLCFDYTTNLFKKVNIPVINSTNKSSPIVDYLDSFLFAESNTLLQNSLLLTIRYANENKDYKNSKIPIRVYQSTEHESILDSQNFTNLLILNKQIISYYANNSYAGLGGTSVLLNLSSMGVFTQQTKDLLINPFMTNLALEFILKNMEFDFLSYVVIHVEAQFGGIFKTTYDTFMLKISPSQDFLDYIKILSEVLFFIIFIYYLYIVLIKIFEQNRAYDRWEKEQIILLNDLVIKFRNRHKPEFIRKLEYILDFTKLNDLIFVSLSIYFIYVKIYILILQFNLNSTDLNTLSLFNIRNQVYTQGKLKETFEIVGSIMLILSSFKFINNLNNGKYFTILTSTIMESKTNNLIFILILFLIQPAFVCFGNLAFGYDLYIFSNIPQSIITCFLIYFRSFDYKTYNIANSDQTGIFFYPYLIILNMVLVNFFISILDRSYVKIKSLLSQRDEKFSLKNVILFCCYKSNQVKSKGINIETEFEDGNKFEVPESKLHIHSKSHNPNEYARDQVEQIRIIDDFLFKMHNKLKNMKNCYMTKQIGGESFFFEDNVYTTIELKHVKCFTLFYLMTISNLITQLENDIEVIEYYRDHLIQFKKRRNFKEATNRIRKINEKYFKDIERKEIEFTKIFEEIENVKRLENLYNQINKGEEKEDKINNEMDIDGNNEDMNKENEALIKGEEEYKQEGRLAEEELKENPSHKLDFIMKHKHSKESLSNEFKMNFRKANEEEIENKLKSEVDQFGNEEIILNMMNNNNNLDGPLEQDNISTGKKNRPSVFDHIINH